MRSEAEVKNILTLAGMVAYKGVQVNDGHTYMVPASDMSQYAQVIHKLIEVVEDWEATR